MTGNSVAEIAVSNIQPSPFQHRRVFDDSALRELAKSIQQDGLIQPVTVRPVNAHFELIAGERRWRAFQLAGLTAIPARILDVDDLQARRLCATENLQRADLTSLEEVMALTELVDASLLEFSDEYAPLATIQEPKWRVRALLGKLESDRANKADYFITKFSDKVDEIFSGLPKPKEYGPFTRNDLPLLFTASDVQQFALEHRLNKAQMKAVDALHKAAPAVFKEIAANSDSALSKMVALVPKPAPNLEALNAPEEEEEEESKPEAVRDLPAQTIRQITQQVRQKEEVNASFNYRAQGTGENEWYTPDHYLELARAVMGGINLDPATSDLANQTVQAEQIFTLNENDLNQEWHGTVWMNPPYAQPHIQDFVEKLVAEVRAGHTKQAIALTHNYTDTAWFHHAAKHCQAICFTRGRIAFIRVSALKYLYKSIGYFCSN